MAGRHRVLAGQGVTAAAALASLIVVGIVLTGMLALADTGRAGTGTGALQFSTYLGGVGEDWAHAIDVGPDGRVYVAGYTDSANFPTTSGAYREDPVGGFDVYVACIAADGTQLEWATLIGGTGEDMPWDIAVDDQGRTWVVGHTESKDFPTTWGALGPVIQGTRDAFVLRLSSDGSSLERSTYLGGEAADKATGVAVGGDGTAWVVGETASGFFPTTASARDRTLGGALDGFMAHLSADVGTLLASTYIGGGDDEQEPTVTLDADGLPCIALSTASSDIGTTSGVHDRTHNGGRDLYMAQYSTDLGALVRATFHGGLGGDVARSLAFGAEGEWVVAGYTFSPDFPTTGTTFAQFNDGVADAFVVVLSPGLDEAPFSGLLGGGRFDVGRSAIPFGDHITFVGYTNSSDFPVTPGAFDTDKTRDDHDLFVVDLRWQDDLLEYGTYIGGTGGDYAMDMVLTPQGTPVVAAYSHSTDFPMDAGEGEAGFDTTFNGVGDAVVLGFTRDTEGPRIGDLTPSQARTGDPFTFSAWVDDETWVETALVVYGIDGGEETTVALTRGPVQFEPIWRATVDIPSDARSLGYRLETWDAIGNANSTQWRTVPVADDDPPWLVEDLTPTSAAAGRSLNLSARIKDNLDLTGVHVEYRQGGGPLNNWTMSSTTTPDVYVLEVWLPEGSVEPLSYSFRFQDAAGNWNLTPQRIVGVLDLSPPVFDTPDAPDHVETGGWVQVRVSVSDNIGVVSAHATYTFDGSTFIYIPLDVSGGGAFTIDIEMPPRERRDLFIELNASDLAGNVARITIELPNEDHTPPEIDLLDVTRSTTTGGEFSISFTAFDHIGIDRLWFRWWFGQGLQQLHEVPGGAQLTWEVDIPSSNVDPLFYVYGAKDGAGNENVSATVRVDVVDDDAPVAVAGPDVEVPPGRSAVMSATGSSDNIGIVRYEWLFEDELTGLPVVAEGPRLNVTFTRTGTVTVRLTVYDAANNTATDTLIVTVRGAGDGGDWRGTALVLGLGIIIVCVALVALLVLHRRRGKVS